METNSSGKELGNLVKKLALIKGELGAIQKDAKHQQGYSYHSSEQVLGMLNQKTSEKGLMIIPSCNLRETITPVDGQTRVFYDYQFLIIDADSGASITATWSQDAPMSMATKSGAIIADDKASGKAHTYAFKYWLMKVFMVSSQDDVDLDENHQEDKSSAPAKSAPPKTAPTPQKVETPSNNSRGVPSCANGNPEPMNQVEVFTNSKNTKQVRIDNATMFGFEALDLLGVNVPHEDGTYEVPALLVRAEQSGQYWNIVKLMRVEDKTIAMLENKKWQVVTYD